MEIQCFGDRIHITVTAWSLYRCFDFLPTLRLCPQNSSFWPSGILHICFLQSSISISYIFNLRGSSMSYKKAKTLVFSKDNFPIALWPTVFVLTFKKVCYSNAYACRISNILIVFRFLRLSAQLKIDVIAIKDFIFKRWV